MTDLTAALANLRPALADRYAAQVRRSFAAMVEVHGPALRGISNSWQFYRTYAAIVAPVLSYASDRVDSDRWIDEAKLARAAAEYADAAVAQWQKKISDKIGALENVTVKQFNGCNYLLTGHRAGRAVAIDQDVILKSSTKGLLFNQFPARIYVDGKFTSEAAYKRMFA